MYRDLTRIESNIIFNENITIFKMHENYWYRDHKKAKPAMSKVQ
jgi:hypothetical protein